MEEDDDVLVEAAAEAATAVAMAAAAVADVEAAASAHASAASGPQAKRWYQEKEDEEEEEDAAEEAEYVDIDVNDEIEAREEIAQIAGNDSGPSSMEDKGEDNDWNFLQPEEGKGQIQNTEERETLIKTEFKFIMLFLDSVAGGGAAKWPPDTWLTTLDSCLQFAQKRGYRTLKYCFLKALHDDLISAAGLHKIRLMPKFLVDHQKYKAAEVTEEAIMLWGLAAGFPDYTTPMGDPAWVESRKVAFFLLDFYGAPSVRLAVEEATKIGLLNSNGTQAWTYLLVVWDEEEEEKGKKDRAQLKADRLAKREAEELKKQAEMQASAKAQAEKEG